MTSELKTYSPSPVECNHKGKLIAKDKKLLIVNLFNSYSKQNRQNDQKQSVTDIIHQISVELGVGIGSVRSTIKTYTVTKTIMSLNRFWNHHRVCKDLDEGDKELIRRLVHSFYLNNEIPTLNKIVEAVNKEERLPSIERSSIHLFTIQIY